ncbi:MAG: hypothetical protein SFV15_10030 [Polyangiaceae bacterium]|nr:hypothetical protein [Polyangiaceae bacterium]
MNSPTQVIARWDLDKTYLRTDFDSLGALLRTATERPDRKRAIPGAAALLRELNRLGAELHIVSGSPRQLRRKIEEKLALDGVRHAELSLKPNLSNLLRLRFRALHEQLGYKLPLLLQAKVRDQLRGLLVREILSGDDAEADAFVYSLYADVLAGRIERTALSEILVAGHVFPDQLKAALHAAAALHVSDEHVRILIHLDRQTPPSHFHAYAPRLVPFYNYQQAAYVLVEDGSLDGEGALRVAQNMMLYHQFDADSLARSYAELARRGHARLTLGPKLLAALAQFPEREPEYAQLKELAEQVSHHALHASLGQPSDPSAAPTTGLSPAEYIALAEEHAGGRNRRPARRDV